MAKRFLAASAALLVAVPAGATTGLVCETAGAASVDVSLVIGSAAISTIVQARLVVDGRDVPVRVAQSWLDPNEVRVDLVDPDHVRHEVRIRAKRRGDVYDGSLWRGGKRRWVRCREG